MLVLLGRTFVPKAEVTENALPSSARKAMGHRFKLCLPIAAIEIWATATLVGSY